MNLDYNFLTIKIHIANVKIAKAQDARPLRSSPWTAGLSHLHGGQTGLHCGLQL